MALMDAIVRQQPGALGDEQSAVQDSFVDDLLDCPHYTRPELSEDGSGTVRKVPEVLLSGDHARIARWRLKQSLGRTWERRPDLLEKRGMSEEEQQLLAEYQQEKGKT
jgi:tRNA (guanine37-N1)-methyltransferase